MFILRSQQTFTCPELMGKNISYIFLTESILYKTITFDQRTQLKEQCILTCSSHRLQGREKQVHALSLEIVFVALYIYIYTYIYSAFFKIKDKIMHSQLTADRFKIPLKYFPSLQKENTDLIISTAAFFSF